MLSYKITIDELESNKDAALIRKALEDADENTYVRADVKRKTITVDTNLSVEEIYQIIEEAGYSAGDLELV